MFCKWCGSSIQSTDSKCKACGRETPAMSDCGGLYNLKYEPDITPVAPVAGAMADNTHLIRQVAELERRGNETQKKTEKRCRMLTVGLGAVLVVSVILLVLCLMQRGRISQLQMEMTRLEEALQEQIDAIPEHTHGTPGDWTGDGNYHWKTVTCNGDTFMVSFEAHTAEDGKHNCTVCAMQLSEHQYEGHVCLICGDETECTDSAEDADHNCDICGKENVSEHSYAAEVKAPTCEQAGYTTYTCPCGDSYQGDEVEATGHAWQDATCTAPKTCPTCGATDGDALGHKDEDPKDHKCDICEEAQGEHADSENDGDHLCDYCGETMGKCQDGDDEDALCDECKNPMEDEENPDGGE